MSYRIVFSTEFTSFDCGIFYHIDFRPAATRNRETYVSFTAKTAHNQNPGA